VDGAPLVIMHYSGVRPGTTMVYLPCLFHSSRNHAAEAVQQRVAVAELEDEYIADLMLEGYEELSGVGYGYGIDAARALALKIGRGVRPE
jgi:hypothetical protein